MRAIALLLVVSGLTRLHAQELGVYGMGGGPTLERATMRGAGASAAFYFELGKLFHPGLGIAASTRRTGIRLSHVAITSDHPRATACPDDVLAFTIYSGPCTAGGGSRINAQQLTLQVAPLEARRAVFEVGAGVARANYRGWTNDSFIGIAAGAELSTRLHPAHDVWLSAAYDHNRWLQGELADGGGARLPRHGFRAGLVYRPRFSGTGSVR